MISTFRSILFFPFYFNIAFPFSPYVHSLTHTPFFLATRFFMNKQRENKKIYSSLKLSADYCDTLEMSCFMLTAFGPVTNEMSNVDPAHIKTHFKFSLSRERERESERKRMHPAHSVRW